MSLFNLKRYYFSKRKLNRELRRAVHDDNVNKLKELLGEGGHIDTRDELYNTLAHLVKSETALEELLANGCDVKGSNNLGDTPLHLAVWKPKELVDALLENGANVNAKNVRGMTPLYNAVACVEEIGEENSLHIVRALIKHGANVSERYKEGKTLLHLVRTANVAELLIENGVEVNACDVYEATPLHYAIKYKMSNGAALPLIKLLLRNGANVSKTFYHCNALNLCVFQFTNDYEDTAIIYELIKYGASVDIDSDHFLSTACRNSDHLSKGAMIIIKFYVIQQPDIQSIHLTHIPIMNYALSCINECNLMKRCKLTNSLSLLQYLRAKCMSSRILHANHLITDDIIRKFPLYEQIIKVKADSYKSRLALLRFIPKIQIFIEIPPQSIALPLELLLHIVEYLSNPDLIRLLKAALLSDVCLVA